MNDTEPPFSPPYVTWFGDGDDAYCVETLQDGTTRPVERTGRMLQPTGPGANQRSEGQAKSVTGSTARPAAAQSGNKAALYLAVPFAEKDDAKSLGARWDAGKKKWYVPHGLDVNDFNPWWPDELKKK